MEIAREDRSGLAARVMKIVRTHFDVVTDYRLFILFFELSHLFDESAYGGVLEVDEIILQWYKLRLS